MTPASTAGQNGDVVQLWGCFNNHTADPNQWWDFGPDGSYSSLPVLWGGGGKVLDVNDADPPPAKNGDKIQVWNYLGGANTSSWLNETTSTAASYPWHGRTAGFPGDINPWEPLFAVP